MIQRHKVDELRGIFCISRADIFQNHIGDILHFVPIVPKRIEQLHVLLCERCLHAVDHVVAVISTLTANIDCRKAANRHISGLCCTGIHRHEASHIFAGGVRFERCLFPDPVCAFLCDGSLGHLIAQFDFKLCTVKACFTGNAGNIELPLLLFSLFFHKSGRCKDKFKLIYGFQLLLQLFIGIHRKAGCRNRHPAAFFDFHPQIISNGIGDVIQNFHIIHRFYAYPYSFIVLTMKALLQKSISIIPPTFSPVNEKADGV